MDSTAPQISEDENSDQTFNPRGGKDSLRPKPTPNLTLMKTDTSQISKLECPFLRFTILRDFFHYMTTKQIYTNKLQ